MRKPLPEFVDGEFYHVYNQGNNRDVTFQDERDYHVFVAKLRYYLDEYMEVCSYCMMGNHYHLLVRVRDAADVYKAALKDSMTNVKVSVHDIITERFRRFVLSYVVYVNHRHGRRGSLFAPKPQRKHVHDERYLRHLVYYINVNPELHGFTDDYTTYSFSSWHDLICGHTDWVPADAVAKWFGGIPAMVAYVEILRRGSDPLPGAPPAGP
ncbi:MAG: hypothetical protein AAGI08_10930 [Bacteroidota bacterium]